MTVVFLFPTFIRSLVLTSAPMLSQVQKYRLHKARHNSRERYLKVISILYFKNETFAKGIDFLKALCYNTLRGMDIPNHLPVWWNWQTRRTQNPKVAIPCRFDPDYRHQKKHLREQVLFLSNPKDWYVINTRACCMELRQSRVCHRQRCMESSVLISNFNGLL